MPPGTGNLATLTLSGGWSANVEQIDPIPVTCPEIPASHLGTVEFEEKIYNDLKDAGGFKATFQHVANTTNPTVRTVQTATITYPNGKTLIGTGAVTEFTPPVLANNTKQLGSLTFIFDGYTGPTWN